VAKFISFSGHEISEECKELSLCMHPRKQLFKKMFTDQLIISYFLYFFFFILTRFKPVSKAKQYGMYVLSVIILHNAWLIIIIN